jgi:hypothetical protein
VKWGAKAESWTMDPRGWPVKAARDMNPIYVWALMSAVRDYREGELPESDHRLDIANDFKILVQDWDPSAK